MNNTLNFSEEFDFHFEVLELLLKKLIIPLAVVEIEVIVALEYVLEYMPKMEKLLVLNNGKTSLKLMLA